MSVKPIEYKVLNLNFLAIPGFIWAEVDVRGESEIGIFIVAEFKIPLRPLENEPLESLLRRAIDTTKTLLNESELHRLQSGIR